MFFYDNCGFPNPQDKFDMLLPDNIGPIIQKWKFLAHDFEAIDPAFYHSFDSYLHKAYIEKHLDTSFLPPDVSVEIQQLMKKYWCITDERGLFCPIKDYKCVINTGKSKPIAAKKIHYGPQETPIMEKCIAKFLQLNQICKVHDGQWLSKTLLMPKPHQEDVHNIQDFAWSFCIKYIPLNIVTWVIANPIPHPTLQFCRQSCFQQK